MSKKVINPFSIALKALTVITFILSCIYPWTNINLGDLNPTGALLIRIFFLIYVIGTTITYLGIFKAHFSIYTENIGIIIGTISSGFDFILISMLMLSNPSYGIQIEIGMIFSILTLLLIIIDKYFLRKYVFLKLFRKIKEKRKDKRKKKEKEKKKKTKEEEGIKEAKKRQREGKVIAGSKQMPRLEERETHSLIKEREQKLEEKEKALQKKEQILLEREKRLLSEEIPQKRKREKLKFEITKKIINPYRTLFKVLASIIFMLSLILIIPNSDLSEFNDVSKIYLRIMFWIATLGFIVSFIGIIKIQSTYKIEKFSLIVSDFAVSIIILVLLIHSFMKITRNINLELGFYLVFLSLIIFSIDTFIYRRYYREKKERETEELPEKKEPEVLTKTNRIETKADFPERWAMIHGEKPTEQENFKHFRELEIEKSNFNYHPNYLHLLIKNEIENFGYRIEFSEKPLSLDKEDASYQFQDLDGSIKGGFKVSTEGKFIFINSNILLIGISFLLASAILLLTNMILPNFSIILFILSIVVLIPLSSLFVIYYIFKSLQRSTLKEIGYTNIYVLEQGSAYYGRETKGMKLEDAQRTLQKPSIGFKMRISFATCVKMMDLEDAKKDLDSLVARIQEF